MDEPAYAPAHPLPQTAFYSVEYPGYVASLDRALETLPQRKLDAAFRRGATALELHLRPHDPFAHPLHGDVVRTSNLVLKVVKRKRKDGTRAEYTAAVVGSVGRTARFRSIADYQYAPDPQNHIVQLRHALDAMDVDAIKAFRFMSDEERAQQQLQGAAEDHPMLDPQLLAGPSSDKPNAKDGESPLGLLGPPLWSRNPVPLLYGYKPSPVSIVQTVTDQNGEERQRLVNRSRWKGYAPATITFTDTNVPVKPPAIVEEARNSVNKNLVQKVAQKLQERPLWTRTALVNQFTPAEEREMSNSKVIVPLCAYMFDNGPWRDTFVRMGYDPRLDKADRIYQRLYFRNTANEITKKSIVAAKKKGKPVGDDTGTPEGRDIQSHIFDGKVLHSDTAVFQMCDITDPLLKGLIEDPDAVRETVDERDGWYKASALARIKAVLRRKFFGMLEGRVVTDEDCADLLEEDAPVLTMVGKSASNPARKLRPHKNNMAKGAQRPEDEIAHRLRNAIRDQEADSDEYID